MRTIHTTKVAIVIRVNTPAVVGSLGNTTQQVATKRANGTNQIRYPGSTVLFGGLNLFDQPGSSSSDTFFLRWSYLSVACHAEYAPIRQIPKPSATRRYFPLQLTGCWSLRGLPPSLW